MIEKIISGGQTGVDRAALDVALELGIPCGGWCPKGRRAMDGVISPKYPLTESPTTAYKERTGLNVRDADGTLILNLGALESGTAYTAQVARKLSCPCLVIDLGERFDPGDIVRWIKEQGIQVLNVAGPREEKYQGIYEMATDRLRVLFKQFSEIE